MSTKIGATLNELLEPDNRPTRSKLRKLFKDPIFIPRYNVALSEQRDLALERLQVIASSKAFSVFDFKKNPLNIFAAHELAGMVDGSMATKLTVQWNLFGGTVLTLGGDENQKLLEKVDTLENVGCFALTELGYGNNAVEMETTATFDARTKELVVHTPSVSAQKYWITNSASKIFGLI